MTNYYHVKWLLKGSDYWNSKRKRMNFDPDFKGENLYELFEEKNKLNEDGLIPLSDYDLRRANFRKANFASKSNRAGVDLSNSKIQEADFRDSRMACSILDNAQAGKANFDCANLKKSSFINAQLSNTSFREANLYKANLEGTNLKYALLYDANLSKASLSNANLNKSKLKGANLSKAKPWLATLYEKQQPSSGTKIQFCN